MNTRTINTRAHAKINLVLRVFEREPSGYHRIETLFQRLTLADDIVVRATRGPRSLDVMWKDAPASDTGPVDANLAWRAATAYQAATGWPGGWEIQLTKRIPAGGGLGGGSSDAAAVLRALNAIAPSPLGQVTLAQIGTTLGADVAFFVHDEPLALGRGRGDEITPLPALTTHPVLLAIPPFAISTADAYAALDAQRANDAWDARPETWDDGVRWELVERRQANDFEGVVFAQYPEVGAVRARLQEAGASVARLSGSGSTVFGVFPAGVPDSLELPVGWVPRVTSTG